MGKAHRLGRIQGHLGRGRLSLPRHSVDRAAPIGVFDSGIGGLSVLQALRAALPGEDLVYVADSAHTPYGERSDAFITQRTSAIARHLRDAHGAKLLVIACNTASAAAAHVVRQDNPGWPVVAIEPALKPAAHHTRTGHVGVLATRSTLASRKFAALRAAVTSAHQDVRFSEVACDGLAASIERWAQGGDGSASRDLLARYLGQLGELGAAAQAIDTLVLGCTHYPLIREQIQQQLPPGVGIVDSGLPVARHARRLLHSTGLLRDETTGDEALSQASLRLLATGSVQTLRAAAQRWLTPTTAALPDVETLAL